MLKKKQLTKEQALQKLRQYCAYQERCHTEAKEKLYSFGLRKQQVEESISQLIEEGCLNEERFAIQFAGGKFRIKQWGKMKIKYELKQKRISEYCINKGLQEIERNEYRKILFKLSEKKWNSIKGAGIHLFIKMTKTRNFLLQRGFESTLVNEALNKLKK